MGRSAASVVWTVVGVVAAVVLALAVVWGPRLYREGRELVGPITDLARAEEELAALDRELPFAPPADGLVREERLEAFLQVRRELLPHYQRFDAVSREVEGRGDSQGWTTAKEVLGVVRDVLEMQVALLRRQGLSPAEFRWLEQQVYDQWYQGLGESEADRRLRLTTEEDLRFLAEAGARHGRSRSLVEMERRLTERLAELASASTAPSRDDPNGALFERHREQIAALDLGPYDELHARLRRAPGKALRVQVGSEEDGRTLVIGGGPAEATPTP